MGSDHLFIPPSFFHCVLRKSQDFDFLRRIWRIPTTKTGKPYVSIFWAWDSARTKADLSDVRIHDLRHSHASFLVNAGRTLYEVQHILGHTQVKTTQRYAHLSHDTLLDATYLVNTALGGMFMPMVSASPAGQVQLVQ